MTNKGTLKNIGHKKTWQQTLNELTEKDSELWETLADNTKGQLLEIRYYPSNYDPSDYNSKDSYLKVEIPVIDVIHNTIEELKETHFTHDELLDMQEFLYRSWGLDEKETIVNNKLRDKIAKLLRVPIKEIPPNDHKF